MPLDPVLDKVQPLRARKSGALKGIATVPGDKSISQRALILGGMAMGETRITGLLESEDVLNTAYAVRALGATVVREGEGCWRVTGVVVGNWRQPEGVLDFGNSGTGSRLMMGAVATTPITAEFTGDASLRSRPMARVLDPLTQFGMQYQAQGPKALMPLTVTGAADAMAISYDVTVASAQVKSALLLAAVNANGTSRIRQSVLTRDHTEKMLAGFGAQISVTSLPGGGEEITICGRITPYDPVMLTGQTVEVPRDPSSAAFPLVAALIVPGSEISIPAILLNPRRTGLIETLLEMGADIQIRNRRNSGGEEIGDLTVRHSALKGVVVPAERAPAMIDEYPVLAIAAAFAQGETVMQGLEELRVKESDRLSAIARGLEANGIVFTEFPDGLIVKGGGGVPGGGTVATHLDHRIAMAFLTLGMASNAPVTVDDIAMIATSFPSYQALMRGLGADFRGARHMNRSVVIAVDGTAASGKGTLAKKLAAHFGFAHLDSGALYRLTALAVLNAKGDSRNEADAVRGAQSIDLSMAGDSAIRTDVVGQAASHVAAIGAVRQALLDFQRNFLASPPGGSPGAVMDGRDIGTVICPDATAKLYIDARPELRAHRRWLELAGMGIVRDEAGLLAELSARDAADKSRPISPLKQAPDAALLDTSDLGIDAAFAAALALVSTKVEGALKDRHRG